MFEMSEAPLYRQSRPQGDVMTGVMPPHPHNPSPCGRALQGYLAHQKHPPPQNHHRSLGIGLLQGHTGGVFLMSEVPL